MPIVRPPFEQPEGLRQVHTGDNLRVVAAPITSLSGHLGYFSATSVPLKDEMVDAGRFGWNEDRRFDLVVDLNEPPLLAHEVWPLGYYAPRDEAELRVALESIRTQPGTSHKPRYFGCEPERCTHGAASVTGCTRCLDACPAGAIVSAGVKVRFDPLLCQGCGTCTAVCPDGAVRYAYPPAATTLETVRVMLEAWRAAGASAPRLVARSRWRARCVRNRECSLPMSPSTASDVVLPSSVAGH